MAVKPRLVQKEILRPVETNRVSIRFEEIPEAARDAARDFCWQRTVGFCVTTGTSAGRTNAFQAGSGTLVRHEGRLGVVTAAHVVDELKRHDQFGLIPPVTRPVTTPIRFDNLIVTRWAAESFSASGPDLALMIVPKADEHVFENYVVSIDLLKHLEEHKKFPNRISSGIVTLSGYLGERTTTRPILPHHDHTGFSMVGATGSTQRHFRSNSHDYIEVEAFPDSDFGPNSWGGISGGGVWHSKLFKDPDGNVTLGSPVFSGVMFFQGEKAKDGSRILTGHGPMSLMELVTTGFAGGSQR